MRMISLARPRRRRRGNCFDAGPHRRRRSERKSALSVRARQVALAVRSFLIRAEDFLVAVRARAEAKISFIMKVYARD